MYAQEPEEIRAYFDNCDRCTLPARGTTEAFLAAPGPWLIRSLVFLFAPLIAFFSYRFFKRTGWLANWEASVITLLVLLLPMFGARIALIDYQYSFSLLMLTLGGWMILSPRMLIRLLGIVPIFWSMFIPSIQVFILSLIAVLITRIVKKEVKFSWDLQIILVVMFLLPVVHRYGLPALFESLRITDGYNAIKPAFLMRAFVVLLLSVAPVIFVTWRSYSSKQRSRESLIFAIGCAVLGLGSFPYLAVGHFANLSDWILPFLPDESDWNSRHQLLQPFGLTLIVLALAHMLGRRRKQFVAVVLVVAVSLNIATYSGYYLDWMKQREVMAGISASTPKFEGVSSVIVTDQALRFNARGRSLRSYEWSGMFERALGVPISVDSDNIDNCEKLSPGKRVTITANRGRLQSLLTQHIGIEVAVDNLLFCNLARE